MDYINDDTQSVDTFDGYNQGYDYKKVFAWLREDDRTNSIIFSSMKVKLFYYAQSECKQIGTGQLTLYRNDQSMSKYLVFQQKEDIVSFQVIGDGQDFQAKQTSQAFVNWVALDWCGDTKRHRFRARFSCNGEDASFMNALRAK